MVELDVVAVGFGPCCGHGGVQGGGDAGVGFGVDLEVGVAHPADPVHPATHTTLLGESSELGDPVVTRQDPTQVADLPLERLDRHHRRRPDHRCFEVLQFGPPGLIQLSGETGQSIDMTR